MEKTYQEQAIAFVLKVVISLGSVYLITEKFITLINQLFHLKSVKNSLWIFHSIYFVLPLLVTCVYFLWIRRNDSVQLVKGVRTNFVIGTMAYVYLVFLAATFYFPITPFLYVGGALMYCSFCFLVWCVMKRRKPAHRKAIWQYLFISFLILLFAFVYLIRNDRTARRFESMYFSNLPAHFEVMDSVNNYISSNANKFQPETGDTLELSLLRAHFAATATHRKTKDHIQADRKVLEKASADELIRISTNRLGLYVNLLFYKSLLIFLPFMAIVLGLIFLYSTAVENTVTPTIFQRKRLDFIVISPTVMVIPEKDFLRTLFVVMVTLTIPVLHPLETPRSSFSKPASFGKPEVITKNYNDEFNTSNKYETFITDSSFQFTMHVDGDSIVLKPSWYDQRRYYTTTIKLDTSLNRVMIALENLNNNVVDLSAFFGDESMIDQNRSDTVSRLLFFKPKKPLNHDIFKKE